MPAVLLRWTIDVCRCCGREAKFPFCEHKPTAIMPPADAQPWCMPITVKAVSAGDERRLRESMAAAEG